MADPHLATVTDLVFEALPDLEQAQLVELLDFIAIQHAGYNYNADNSSRAKEIASYVAQAPFAVSPTGVKWYAVPSPRTASWMTLDLSRSREHMAASPSSPVAP